MSEQPPAGWYPDQDGNLRFWDGAGWTEHVREPEASQPADVVDPQKGGTFSKLRKAATDKLTESRRAKEEFDRKQAEDAGRAGLLVTSGVFGTSTVEIYDGGYVRVAAGVGNEERPVRTTGDTPYERLRSIKFTQPEQRTVPEGTSGLESAIGPAVAGLLKGSKTLMKVTPTGIAVTSATHLAKSVAASAAQKSFLTIVTDKQIHTLNNQVSNGYFKSSNKGHHEVGLALEAAGNSVLGISAAQAEAASLPLPSPGPEPVEVAPRTTEPTLADRLRELADLHREGVLSDDEFAGAKARLLGGL